MNVIFPVYLAFGVMGFFLGLFDDRPVGNFYGILSGILLIGAALHFGGAI